MSQRVTVIDPRMPPPAQDTRLAERTGDLNDRTVLLLDNGKLREEYGPYWAVFEGVTEELQRRFPRVTIDHHRDDLLVGLVDRLEDLAASIARRGIAGVVIALCDWGVSQPSTILAAALERHGVPASVVAMEVGFLQARATAALLAPGLPLTQLQSLRNVSYDEMLDESRRKASVIVDGLTATPRDLQARWEAHNPEAPPTATESKTLDLDSADPTVEFTALMAENGLGDGFPLIAPTPDRVNELLDAMGASADDVVWPAIPPRSVPVTAIEVATLAVMAGVKPQWAPIILAAYRAMSDATFRLFQAAITTHPSGTFVLVSGPDADALGVASGRGCLGPGFPANATIGRAVSLGHSFLLGARPGGSDLTAQGSPAEYSYCCAENLAASPWPGVNSDYGFPSETTVTVVKVEGPHNMTDQQSSDPDRLLETFADTIATLGGNTAYVSGCQNVLLLNPEHAALLADAGWRKHDVQSFLFDRARNSREALRGRGLTPIWPQWFDAAPRVPVVETPEDIVVAVVGGPGPASQVAIPWGYSRAVTLPIAR